MKIVINDRWVIDIKDSAVRLSERPKGIESVCILEYSYIEESVEVFNKSGHIVEVQA